VAAFAVAALGGGLWWTMAGASGANQTAATPRSSVSATSTPSAGPTSAARPTVKPSPAPSPASSAATAPVPDAKANVPDQKPVPPRTEVVLPPVGLAERADFGNKVSARLTRSVRIEGKGQGIGERSGPSLLVTVEITNSSAATIDLDYIVVNLYGGPDDAPGQLLLGDPHSAPMSGKLAPKASRSGTYVLRLPDPTPDEVTVTVNYGAETPTAVFTGKVSTSP